VPLDRRALGEEFNRCSIEFLKSVDALTARASQRQAAVGHDLVVNRIVRRRGSRMGKVVVDVSPSVDGYVAGPGVAVGRPFGEAGTRLHRWMGEDGLPPTAADRDALERMYATARAVVIGRRMFDVGIDPWGEDGAFRLPVFVITNRPGEDLVRGPTVFRFVTEGAARAVELAAAVAGDGDVMVAGGADVIQQCLAAGLVDEIRLHVVPVLLGAGTRLFARPLTDRVELEQTDQVATPFATHLTFRVATSDRVVATRTTS
jgi:dihydrofolate reductase